MTSDNTPRRREIAVSVGNFLLLQVGWFACVGGAAKGIFWIGPAVVAGLVALHLAMVEDRRRELLLIVGFGAVGTVLDSTLSGLGLLTFAGSPALWLCPLWISALWLHFGASLRGPLASFRSRPWLAALFGGVGAPMAYWAGVHLGAAAFHPQPIRSVLAIAAIWGILLPLALAVAWRSAPP